MNPATKPGEADLTAALLGAANYIDVLGGDSKGYRAFLAALGTAPATPVPASPSDEQICHLWDTHVGPECAKYPLSVGETIRFARAVLAAQPAPIEPAIRRADAAEVGEDAAAVPAVVAKEAALWREWVGYLRNLRRKPFDLTMAIQRYDASGSIADSSMGGGER